MKTDAHFEEAISRRGIRREWCEAAVQQPVQKQEQENGSVQYWGYSSESDRYFRVIVLQDGETMHTAFWDRNFTKRTKRKT